jgi:hypothetical protein
MDDEKLLLYPPAHILELCDLFEDGMGYFLLLQLSVQPYDEHREKSR